MNTKTTARSGATAATRRTSAAKRATAARRVTAPAGAGQLVTLRPNGQITLPAEVRQQVGARSGDVFLAEVRDDEVVLRPKKLVDAADAWFWTREWQAGEREATADIRAGRVRRARDVEELLAELRR